MLPRYEILRGLKTKAATAQVERFDVLCASLEALPITDEIIVHAADVYAGLHQSGQLISDVDILIASTAIGHGFTLATNNEKHHCKIAGLSLENWLAN